MKAQTFKIVIGERTFMKVVYSVDSIVYNIVIYEKKGEHLFTEIIANECNDKLQTALISNDYVVECDKSEIIEFMEDLFNSEKQIEKEFTTVVEQDNADVLFFENFLGMKVALINGNELKIPKALRILDNKKMGYGYTSAIPQDLAFYQVLNIAIKQQLLEGDHFIQVSNNAFYGIRTEGKYTYLAEIVFNEVTNNVSCSFVVPVKRVNNAVKMLDNPKPEMKAVVEKNAKTLVYKILDILNAEPVEE